MQDPFYLVKEEVEQSLSGAVTLLDRWKELVDTVNTAQDEEFKWTTTELKKVITSLNWDIQDLEETIGIVEPNPEKYKLSMEEVKRRKEFVSTTKRTVNSFNEKLNSHKAKIDKDMRSLLLQRKSEPTVGRLEQAIVDDNEDFIGNERKMQEQLRRQEDQHLDGISEGVEKLYEMGEVIGDAIAEGDVELGRLQDDVDSTTNRIMYAGKKVSEMIDRSSSKWSWGIIIVLAILLIILIVIVFYV